MNGETGEDENATQLLLFSEGDPKNQTFAVQVRGAMEIALFIQNIQEERAEVKKSDIFTKLMMKYNWVEIFTKFKV